MADKKDEKKTEATGNKKKPPIVFIAAVIGLLVVVSGFLVGKQVMAKSKGAGGKQPVQPGPIMPLDDFLVNLADPSGDHFLKITVNLELTKASGESPDSLKDQVPMIRDAVLTALCSKTRDEISPLSGRDELKAEIVNDVNAELGATDVEKVYFSDFVTQ